MGGSKAVWNFSKNSSDLVAPPFPKDQCHALTSLVPRISDAFGPTRLWQGRVLKTWDPREKKPDINFLRFYGISFLRCNVTCEPGSLTCVQTTLTVKQRAVCKHETKGWQDSDPTNSSGWSLNAHSLNRLVFFSGTIKPRLSLLRTHHWDAQEMIMMIH